MSALPEFPTPIPPLPNQTSLNLAQDNGHLETVARRRETDRRPILTVTSLGSVPLREETVTPVLNLREHPRSYTAPLEPDPEAALSARLVVAESVVLTMEAALARQSGEIEENRKTIADLEYLATHDRKTGLLNDYGLELVFDKMASEGRLGFLELIDVTNLKKVNDTDRQKHIGGDYLLKQTARIAVRSIREGVDAVVRVGGDEIILLVSVPDCPMKAANIQRAKQSVNRRLGYEMEGFKDRNPDLFYADLAYATADWEEGRTLPSLILEADDKLTAIKKIQHERLGQYR